jgi:hypothetical protein
MLAQAYGSGDSGAGAVVMVVFLAVGVAIALWSGSAATHKGYSYWLGFFLGLFLGLIGRIIVAVLPERQSHFVPGRPL